MDRSLRCTVLTLLSLLALSPGVRADFTDTEIRSNRAAIAGVGCPAN